MTLIIPILLTCLMVALGIFVYRLKKRPTSAKYEVVSTPFDVIVEAMSDGVVLLDAGGKVELMNHMARKITGFDPRSSQDLDAEGIFGHAIALRHRYQDFSETTLHCADDRDVAVELSIQVIVLPDGPRTMLTFRSISELKQAQTLLLQQAHIIDKTDSFVFVADCNKRLEWCNPRFESITGYAVAEFAGRRAPDLLFGPGTNQADVEMIIDSTDRCVPYQSEVLLYNKAGRPFWAQIDVHPLYSANGALHKWVGLGFDTTERRYATQMQTDFISMVSHELRTPLTVVSGALEALSMDPSQCTAEVVEMMVDMGQRNCRQLDKLISDLLDINKMHSGTLSFKCENLDLLNVVQTAVLEIRPLANKRKISLEVTPNSAEGVVFADPLRVTQIVTNLVTNAIKFSKDGTRIDVGVENRGHVIRVGVQDQGRGIPESFRPMIFRQFSREPSVEADGTEGFGLGLSICKRLVEQMDGSIDFRSVQNEGTYFYFEIPVSPTAPLSPSDDVALPQDSKAPPTEELKEHA